MDEEHVSQYLRFEEHLLSRHKEFIHEFTSVQKLVSTNLQINERKLNQRTLTQLNMPFTC